MSSSSSTCKLPIVGSSTLCILNSEWSSKCVKLLVLFDNQAWSGKFQMVEDEDTADLLDQLSMTEIEYVEETKKALTTHGGAENFAYTIDCDKFTWKKCISKDMSVKFGYTLLQKVSAFSVFEEIIDKTLQENLQLNTQLKRAAEQNDTFTEENEHLKTRLNKLIEKKSEMESSLYSQFVYLLNEKKRRIKELQKQFQPSYDGENEQGVNQSDSDPFGSDTELDSEEEKQSPSKAGSRDRVLVEEENICILPKRLKTPSKIESVAGPSGIGQNSKDTRCVSKSPSNSSSNNVKTTIKPQGRGKKPVKFSCVMGKIADSKVQNSSEEDVFMFPKRSKRISSCVDLEKPSTSKIKYDSDDEMPLYVKPSISKIKYDSDDEIKTSDRTQKIETDSDSTPSGIDPIDVIKTITVKTPHDINSKCVTGNSNGDGKDNISRSDKNSDKDSMNSKKSAVLQDPSFKDFSNSTLEVLNQLV